MTDIKLDKCPMCGSVDAPEVETNYKVPFSIAVCKQSCGGCGLNTAYYDTPQEAAAAWNRRDGCDGWIYVEDQLPDYGEVVMAYGRGEIIPYAWREKKSWYRSEWKSDLYFDIDVLFWKPRPDNGKSSDD